MVFAKYGQLDRAAACTLDGKLPAYTPKLKDKTFTITGGYGGNSPVFTNSADGTKIQVSTVGTADGYRVTDVKEI